MKQRINFRMTAMITIVFASLLICSSCKKNGDKKCEGYTGEITDTLATKLVNRCHFLSEDSIDVWVKRYENFKNNMDRKDKYNIKAGDSTDAAMAGMNADLDKSAAQFLRGGSVSFNSCIIKKILCHENSIGLRVLYGIDSKNRIHIILVGIKPDYSNLYVEAEDECCTKSMTKDLGAGLSGLTAISGGAEYGQMP
jgi:hypothetical protein